MKIKNIREAKNPDLRNATVALRRAAKVARQTAIETNTHLVVMKNGNLTRLSARVLRSSIP